MYYFEDYPVKAAFILHPKTGTRSMESVLQSLPGVKMSYGRHGIHKPTLARIRDAGGKIFGTLRNPYDLVVSWYHYNQRRNDKPNAPYFLDWLPGFIQRGNNWFRYDLDIFYSHSFMTDEIRYELGPGEQLKAALESVGLEMPGDFPHFGAAKERDPWEDYYDQAAKDLVYETFKQDFERFGYPR